MGMYDTVIFREQCSNCGGDVTGQSKGGDCRLITYNSDHVPYSVAKELDYISCEDCGFRPTLKTLVTEPVFKLELEAE